MKTTKKQLVKQVNGFSQEELRYLGSDILGIDKDEHLNGTIVVEELYQAYQTPAGYVVRNPDFDELCDAVVEKLVKVGNRKFANCWEKLQYVAEFVFKVRVGEMTDKEREVFIEELEKTPMAEKRKKGSAATGAGFGLLAADAVLKRSSPYIVSAVAARQLTAGLIGKTVIMGPPIVLGLPLLGPAGWVLTMLGLNSVLGTNWGKVIPALLWITTLREKHILQEGS